MGLISDIVATRHGMGRTIGAKNIALVKRLTKRAEAKNLYGAAFREYIILNIPDEVFETWEGARTEIDRIIDDTVMDG